jgi:hypothetical protein
MWTNQVITATQELAGNFHNKKITILTESDLKTYLVAKIREKVDPNVTVNTETPWYDIYTTNQTYYIDITAFDNDKLEIIYDPATNRKGYKYEDEAIAVELKYFRYVADLEGISGDFKKMNLLTKMPKNDCFIIALARTKDLFDAAKKFMEDQMSKYRIEYNGKVRVYLFDPESLVEII